MRPSGRQTDLHRVRHHITSNRVQRRRQRRTRHVTRTHRQEPSRRRRHHRHVQQHTRRTNRHRGPGDLQLAWHPRRQRPRQPNIATRIQNTQRLDRNPSSGLRQPRLSTQTSRRSLRQRETTSFVHSSALRPNATNRLLEDRQPDGCAACTQSVVPVRDRSDRSGLWVPGAGSDAGSGSVGRSRQ